MAATLNAACNTSNHTDVSPTAPSVQTSPPPSAGPSHYFEVTLGPGTKGTPSVSATSWIVIVPGAVMLQ